MAIVPLPLPPGAEARALLHHLLEQGDIVGRDAVGRTIIQLAVDDWALERLMTFDAESADLEDGGDDEPEADEEDGPPVLQLEFVPPQPKLRLSRSSRPELCPQPRLENELSRVFRRPNLRFGFQNGT